MKRPKVVTATIQVRVPPKMKTALRRQARETGVPVSWLVRMMIAEGLDNLNLPESA